jgi:nicotinamidase-related amidase
MAQENPLSSTGRAKAATETSLIQRRPENAIVLLLEMQPEIVASSRTQPEAQLRRVASVLTRCARELDIPVLTSVVPLAPGVAPELIEELSACKAVPRNTVSALDDESVAAEFASSERRLVALGGVSSEIALLHTALSLRRQQYEVHLLIDCCGGLGERSEQAALRQMEAAGVTLSSVPSFLTALISDLSSTNGRIVMNALAAFWS